MTLDAYIPVLIQIAIALAVGLGILAASHLFGQRTRPNVMKDSGYECGVPIQGAVHSRFTVKFYVTAMLFIIFDIEVVFLVPWAMIYRDFLAAHIPILVPILFFFIVLIVGLVYELKKGGLEWERTVPPPSE